MLVTFHGGFFRKVFGVWNFYANQLVFRVKQPYTMSFVEIPVGVVSDLADFTENPPALNYPMGVKIFDKNLIIHPIQKPFYVQTDHI